MLQKRKITALTILRKIKAEKSEKFVLGFMCVERFLSSNDNKLCICFDISVTDIVLLYLLVESK